MRGRAVAGAGLDWVAGLSMGLPQITSRAGTLARPFCSGNRRTLARLVAGRWWQNCNFRWGERPREPQHVLPKAPRLVSSLPPSVARLLRRTGAHQSKVIFQRLLAPEIMAFMMAWSS